MLEPMTLNSLIRCDNARSWNGNNIAISTSGIVAVNQRWILFRDDACADTRDGFSSVNESAVELSMYEMGGAMMKII